MKWISKAKRAFKSSYWLKSASYTFSTKVFESGIGLLTFLVLVRVLPREEFGVWVLLISVSAMAESMRKAFVCNPLVRFLNISDKSEHTGIMTSSSVQNVLYTVGSSLLIAGLARPLSVLWNSPDLESILYAFVAANLFIGFFSQCNFIQQANLEYKGTFYAFLLRKGLFFLFTLYCLFFYQEVTVIQLVLSQIGILLLIIPLNIYFTKPFLTRLKWSAEQFKRLIGFGKFTIGTNLSSMAFGNIDSWLLGSLLTVQAVALYNPAIRILALVEIPIVSLSIISYPQLARRIKEGNMEDARRLYEKSLGIILSFIIPCCLLVMIFSDQIILLIAGNEYLESSSILQVTMLFGLFIPFNRQLGITLNALGKPRTNLFFVITNLSINIICNYLCILQFGLMGAAYGTLIAYLLSLIYGQWLGYKLFGTSLFPVFQYILKIYMQPKSMLKTPVDK